MSNSFDFDDLIEGPRITIDLEDFDNFHKFNDEINGHVSEMMEREYPTYTIEDVGDENNPFILKRVQSDNGNRLRQIINEAIRRKLND